MTWSWHGRCGLRRLSLLFAHLDRMLVVALIFVFYAAISYAIFDRLSRRRRRSEARVS